MNLRSTRAASTKPANVDDPVQSDRGFDLQCLRSALDFVNRVDVGEGSNAGHAFDWLPEVLSARASKADFRMESLPTQIELLNDTLTARVRSHFLLCHASLTNRRVMGPKQAITFWKTNPDGRRFSGHWANWWEDSWLNDNLAGLKIYQRVLISEDTTTRVCLPLLRDVGACLAYAVAVMAEDRWDALRRIKGCLYRPSLEYGSHLFLDYRLDKNGKLRRGTPRTFCCTEHANRYHQKQWRERQTAKAKAKGNVRQPITKRR